MGEIEKLEVSHSENKQLEDYESSKFGVLAIVKVHEDEDPHEVYDDTVVELEDMVSRSLARRIMRKKRDKDD